MSAPSPCVTLIDGGLPSLIACRRAVTSCSALPGEFARGVRLTMLGLLSALVVLAVSITLELRRWKPVLKDSEVSRDSVDLSLTAKQDKSRSPLRSDNWWENVTTARLHLQPHRCCGVVHHAASKEYFLSHA